MDKTEADTLINELFKLFCVSIDSIEASDIRREERIADRLMEAGYMDAVYQARINASNSTSWHNEEDSQ